MAWLDGWGSRKPITIPTVSAEQTDINVEVIVAFESGMNTDFSDIRFTESDGTTELYHFRDKYTTSTSALFIVKVPVIPVTGKTIYLYFKNASASSASDGANTFPFFEDFSSDLSKWEDIDDPEYCFIDAGILRFILTWGHTLHIVKSKASFSPGHALIFRALRNGGSGTRRFAGSLGEGFTLDADEWMYYWSSSDAGNGAFFYSTYHLDTEPIVEGDRGWTRNLWSKVKIWNHRSGAKETGRLKFNDGDTVEKEIAISAVDRKITISASCNNPAPNIFVLEVYVEKLPQDATEITPITPGETEATFPGHVRIKHSCTAKELLSTENAGKFRVRSGEVAASISGKTVVGVDDLGITSAINGSEDKQWGYLEATVNGGVALSTSTSAKVVAVMNTGYYFSTTSKLGAKSSLAVKLTKGTEFIGIYNSGEPVELHDANGGIDASSITIETVNPDGTTISSGTGNAVKFLVLA